VLPLAGQVSFVNQLPSKCEGAGSLSAKAIEEISSAAAILDKRILNTQENRCNRVAAGSPLATKARRRSEVGRLP
jgi:hypothetical protein